MAAKTVLTPDLWVLEIYRTIMQSLQSMVWLLLVFFAVAMLAYGIARRTNREAAA
jgi:ABC-type arginine transport system permease subunit